MYFVAERLDNSAAGVPYVLLLLTEQPKRFKRAADRMQLHNGTYCTMTEMSILVTVILHWNVITDRHKTFVVCNGAVIKRKRHKMELLPFF
jgi:hypothetical protein